MNTPTQNPSVVHVGNTDIAVIAHQNQRVILSEMLAKVLGTEEVRIRQNYTRNQSRFEEGKHCFKLEGDELRTFKRRVSESYSVEIAPNVNAIMLWTERGAARHAKFLDTDEAWDKFDLLESAYFDVKPVPTPERGNDQARVGITPTPLKNALVRLPHPDSLMEQCKRYMADLVALGPVDAKEAMQACLTAGFSEVTIHRAKKALGVVSRKTSDSPYSWVWAKPDAAEGLWLTVTRAELGDLVEQRAKALLNKAIALPPQDALTPTHPQGQRGLAAAPVDATAGKLLAGQRLVMRLEVDGRWAVEPLGPKERVMTLDAFADMHERLLEEEGLAIVPKELADTVTALMQSVAGRQGA